MMDSTAIAMSQGNKSKYLIHCTRLYAIGELHRIGLCMFRFLGHWSSLSLIKSDIAGLFDDPAELSIVIREQYKIISTLGGDVATLMGSCADYIRKGIDDEAGLNGEDVQEALQLSDEFMSNIYSMFKKIDGKAKNLTGLDEIKAYRFSKSNLPSADARIAGIFYSIYDGLEKAEAALAIVKAVLEGKTPHQNFKKTTHLGGKLQLFWPEH
jgi:hypothetical protein